MATPLHDAVRRRDPARLEALLAAGHDPNALDEAGQPPLRHVLTGGIGFVLEPETVAMIRALLAAGADPKLAGVGKALVDDANSMVTAAGEANDAAALARLLGER